MKGQLIMTIMIISVYNKNMQICKQIRGESMVFLMKRKEFFSFKKIWDRSPQTRVLDITKNNTLFKVAKIKREMQDVK